MIAWTDILTGLAVVLAFLAIVLLSLVVVAFARRLLPRRKPVKLSPEKKKEKTKRRTENMSKDQTSEGITFNDIFMFMIAVPLVLLWVGFAGFVIHTGLNNSAVLENIEAYTTLIAILGGPALLIIKDALDVWKQEQAEKTAFYKVKAQAVIDYNDASQKQAQMIEANEQTHEHGKKVKK
jgi:membrane protein implicated in regulation of membrane protease activity